MEVWQLHNTSLSVQYVLKPWHATWHTCKYYKLINWDRQIQCVTINVESFIMIYLIAVYQCSAELSSGVVHFHYLRKYVDCGVHEYTIILRFWQHNNTGDSSRDLKHVGWKQLSGYNCFDINCNMLHLMAWINQFIDLECNDKKLFQSMLKPLQIYKHCILTCIYLRTTI